MNYVLRVLNMQVCHRVSSKQARKVCHFVLKFERFDL